ncbi:hypothetical protein PHYC_02296 [Phycisphaerales bacterium]|nr:hypothetical protein PHYC_02296 [Phycisphaerales bacterium]
MNRSSWVVAALLTACSAASAQTFFPGAGGFQDISAMPGTIPLGIPFGDSTTVSTSIGNMAFPAGDIKISYNGTIGSNVGTSESTDSHMPLPTDELYDSKTAMAVIWDTPDAALPGTQQYFREFFEDPDDIYYIVQWNNLPMGGMGGTTTFQTRVNNLTPWRQQILATFSYHDIEQEGVLGGAFATIGYQSNQPGLDTVQWSFNQTFAVRNQMDLHLVIPSPAGFVVLAGSVGLLARRRR